MLDPGPFFQRCSDALEAREVPDWHLVAAWKQRGLSTRAAIRLAEVGFHAWGAFSGMAAKDVYRGLYLIPGCGPVTCREIMDAAEAAGVVWVERLPEPRLVNLRRQEGQLITELGAIRLEIEGLSKTPRKS